MPKQFSMAFEFNPSQEKEASDSIMKKLTDETIERHQHEGLKQQREKLKKMKESGASEEEIKNQEQIIEEIFEDDDE